MNKNEFITAIADNKALSKLGLSKSTISLVCDTVLDTIETALKKGDEVRLTGFGNFYAVDRKAGKGRNPQTGEEIKIKASKQPKFRAGKQLKDALNGSAKKKK